MPAINTAEDAVKVAEKFLAKYHAFRILKRVVRQGETWVTEFDVAVLGVKIVRVTLDVQTGNIIEYGEIDESGH
jgi:hypothetical protein